MTLAQISKAHRNALEVVKTGVAVYSVTNQEILAFDLARRVLQKSVDSLQAAEPLQAFVSICSQLHARICRTPCRPPWLFETFKLRIQELQSRLRPILAVADEKLRSEFKTVCDRIADVKNIQVNPLAADVRAMLELSEEASEQSIVVIRQPALWPEVRAAVDPDNKRKRMIIMKPSELRRAAPVDRLILFGPPWLFQYRDESFLFRSPVAGNVELFAFDHDCGGEVSASALDVQLVTFKGPEARHSVAENLQGEPLSMFKQRSFVPRAFPGPTSELAAGQAVCVDAWPVHLGGNMGTYLDPEGTVFAVECAHDGERAVCTEVERRDVEELETGDLIVLTTEGGGDLIRPLADKILGERALIYRQHQSTWKGRLRECVDKIGPGSTVEKLRALGSSRANEPNLRNWLSDRKIGPTDLETDFAGILALVDLSESRGQYCEAIDAIRRAHQSAGFQLQDQLKNNLKKMDVRKAFVEGLLEVRTEINGPAKTIFQVEQINRQSVSVASYHVNRVVELEDPNR